MDSKEMDHYLSDNSSEWSSAEELDDSSDELNQINCLFCCQTCPTFDTTFTHFKSDHNFDLINICKEFKLNTYQYIKVLNYLRKEKPNCSGIKELIESKVWDNEEFLKPVIIDDQLLMFDIESECFSEHNYESDIDLKTNPSNENESEGQLSQKQLTDRLRKSEEHIKALELQLKDMKELMLNCLSEESNNGLNVGHLSKSEDSYYVSSYSHYSIHLEMLCDRIRTNAYKEAILQNEDFFRNKTVLDIGCGTGILSLFAAKAGAKLVVAVDQSDIIYKAIDIVRENGFNNKIKLIKNKVESIDFVSLNLPQKYDIIISEWMGYFLLFEGMLDTILYARDNLLNESGILLPNQCLLSIAGLSDQKLVDKYINFWDNVYGFRFNCMKSEVRNEALIQTVSKENIKTNAFAIKHFNLMECNVEETQKINSKFELICNSDEPIVAIVGWFDSYFNYRAFDTKITLSTSPFSEDTHWRQTVFLLKNPLIVKNGDKVEGTIDVLRNKKEVRSLIVEIKFNNNDEKQVFYV